MSELRKPAEPATCLHCSGTCRLTNGREVYPHRTDLYPKLFYVCDECDASVRCHPDSDRPLGDAANKATRTARMKLHNLRLDPLWKKAPGGKEGRKAARRHTYKFLAHALGIDPKECHTGMFTIDRCRDAWRALRDQTPATIHQWNQARRQFAQEAESDRKRKKHGQRRRRASRDGPLRTVGRDFCPEQASSNEVPW